MLKLKDSSRILLSQKQSERGLKSQVGQMSHHQIIVKIKDKGLILLAYFIK